MPEGRVQWCIRRPVRGGAVCVARAVLVLKGWASRGQRWEFRYVGVEGVSIVDAEVASVDFVQAVSAIEIRKRRNARCDPSGVQHCGFADAGGIIGIVQEEEIFVGVAKEDIGDDMRRVSLNDLVEEISRIWNRVRSIPTAEHVADDPNSLAAIFSSLKLINDPAENTGVVAIG